MYQPVYEKAFQKDLKLTAKRGKNLKKIESIMESLINGDGLDKRFLNHKLRGNYIDCWECHIEPDWLLIYTIKHPHIIFVRTGTHSDLFK
jgi:mRNA interferase YafQ